MVLQLVHCETTVVVVVVGVDVVFLDCDGFSLLCTDLFCSVDCCFVVAGSEAVVCLVLVLHFVGLVV